MRLPLEWRLIVIDMCDPASIAIMAFKVFSAQREAKAYSSVVGQKVRQAGEILANAKEEMAQLSKAQDRRRGVTKAVYGKAGVELTGTPQKLFEQQDIENEKELLKIKYNADLEAGDLLREAKAIKKKGLKSFAGNIYNTIGEKNITNTFTSLSDSLGLGN